MFCKYCFLTYENKYILGKPDFDKNNYLRLDFLGYDSYVNATNGIYSAILRRSTLYPGAMFYSVKASAFSLAAISS